LKNYLKYYNMKEKILIGVFGGITILAAEI
jgi:hypothetical protein